MKKILIIGASSGIGAELVKLYCKRKDHLVMGLARNIQALQLLQQQNNPCFQYKALDLTKWNDVNQILDNIAQGMAPIDVVILSASIAAQQKGLINQQEQDILLTNVMGYTSAALWATQFFQSQGFGHLVGISSVARNFGTPQPAYNASKAFEAIYLQGLSSYYSKPGFRLTIIYPGFVRTPMTKKMSHMFWDISAPKAARLIAKAIDKKKFIAYIPRRWQGIDWILRSLPQGMILRLLRTFTVVNSL